MRLPIDTSRLKFLVVAPAEPLRQYEEGKPREAWAPRTDVNGEVLWRVQLVALGDGEAEIIRVAVVGDPKRGQGEMVTVDALTAQPGEMDGGEATGGCADVKGVGDGRAVGHGLSGSGDPIGGLATGRDDGRVGPERC